MVIKKLYAYEIFNAQGQPTLACSITLANNQTVTSSIASGFTSHQNAATYSYDKDERLFSKGMKEAANYINNTIAPLFTEKPINALAMDSQLMDLDTTVQKNSIGANTILVVSIALFKAQAYAENLEPYAFIQSISGTKETSIPQPIASLFEGRTLNSQKNIKEFLTLPQEQSFEKNIEALSMLQHHTKKLLSLKKEPISVGKFGSFIPFFQTTKEYLELIEEVLQTLPNYTYQIGLNVDASEIYDHDTKTYAWNNKAIVARSLIEKYESLVETYSYINYIQDGLASSDRDAWKVLTNNLQDTVQVAADSIFCSNAMSIRKGILQGIGNNIIIRPEYVGTISQTIAAIDACKKNNIIFTLASDLDITSETFTSDLAVGTGAPYIKIGGLSRNEFVAKYNRILYIEQTLTK